eukprot:3835086-Amphidinium_carterae.2
MSIRDLECVQTSGKHSAPLLLGHSFVHIRAPPKGVGKRPQDNPLPNVWAGCNSLHRFCHCWSFWNSNGRPRGT